MIRKIGKWGASFWRLLLLKLRFGKRLDAPIRPRGVYVGRNVRFEIAKGALLSLGQGVYISEGCRLTVTEGAILQVGDAVYFGKDCMIVARERIEIGEHSLLANEVALYDHDHVFTDPHRPIADQGFRTGAIRIGENCWVATRAVVTRGVTVSEHVVLGANSVLTKDAPAHTVWGGVPARCIRESRTE